MAKVRKERESLIQGLNDDLAREYQAIIAYVVYSQMLKGAAYMAIAEELWVMAIPINVLVCLAFMMISEVGRVLEDPFTLFWNGLPLSALTRTIESNLRQRLGDEDIRPMLRPDADGVLM